MERQPQKVPLPCFGLEHDRYDPQCRACPHADDCVVYMGSRANKVPLDRLKFDLTPEDAPEKFQDSLRAEALDVDDPELPHLQRLYTDCYASVFHQNPVDNVSQFKNEIAINAQKAQCSVRMFILANMVAHSVHEQTVISNTQKNRAAKFRARLLSGDLSVKRAKTYQEMCHDRFGTFSLTSLAVLTDSDDKDVLADTMLRSEVTAARWLVRYKIFNGGPAEMFMYESEELHLAPEWLAIEKSYIDLILFPREKGTLKASDAVDRHRHSARLTHGFYKRNSNNQRLAFLTRQSIMPEAVRQVVSIFRHTPADFLYPRETITQPMVFWNELGIAIRHYHCWLYLNGEPSYFTPRRNETLPRRS